MDNVKIYATIILPGRVLVDEKSISETDKKEKGKRVNYQVRSTKPAKQSLHLVQEAYDEFISTPVVGQTPWFWKKLSKAKKVKMHLDAIAETLGGVLESFEIAKD